MKQVLIKILSAIFQVFDGLLIRLHLKRPKVIVFLDGGICSQMQMYVQGQYYAESGLDVYYDTRWYEVCGKDQHGVHPRIFEFTEMWPTQPFKIIRGWRLWIYRHLFKNGELVNGTLPCPDTITCSMYLYGYWDLPYGEHKRLFAKYFSIENAAIPVKIDKVDPENIIGVHVRRGDLAKGDSALYGGVSEGYFMRAIDFCNKEFKPKKYLFFSDEPDWVEQNICPHLTLPYEIMRGNKAWEDLWLLAQCPVIVASQGSFGKMAARLNPDAVLIQCDNEYAKHDRKNNFYIK